MTISRFHYQLNVTNLIACVIGGRNWIRIRALNIGAQYKRLFSKTSRRTWINDNAFNTIVVYAGYAKEVVVDNDVLKHGLGDVTHIFTVFPLRSISMTPVYFVPFKLRVSFNIFKVGCTRR